MTLSGFVRTAHPSSDQPARSEDTRRRFNHLFRTTAISPPDVGFLEQDNQARLSELVRQASDENTRRLLPICLEIGALEETCRAKIIALGYEQLGLLSQTSKHPDVIGRAVDIYCSSRSWDQANAHYNHVIAPVLTELTPAQNSYAFF